MGWLEDEKKKKAEQSQKKEWEKRLADSKISIHIFRIIEKVQPQLLWKFGLQQNKKTGWLEVRRISPDGRGDIHWFQLEADQDGIHLNFAIPHALPTQIIDLDGVTDEMIMEWLGTIVTGKKQ